MMGVVKSSALSGFGTYILYSTCLQNSLCDVRGMWEDSNSDWRAFSRAGDTKCC